MIKPIIILFSSQEIIKGYYIDSSTMAGFGIKLIEQKIKNIIAKIKI